MKATKSSSSIITNPSKIIVPDNAGVGTQVGSLSVSGGRGTYTFSLTSNPNGYYTIRKNILRTAKALVAGINPITIQAVNRYRDRPILSTNIAVTASSPAPILSIITFHLLGF
jgi:hypothetical protein